MPLSNKPKVLLITSVFRWYSESYVRALVDCGCEVRHLNESVVLPKKDVLGRIKKFFRLDVTKSENGVRKSISKKALELFKEFKPNIVILTLGNQLLKETLLFMKERSILINIFGDTLQQYPYVEEVADAFDIFYSYEVNDVLYLQKKGINAKPLMGLGDPKQYYPLKLNKKIDICFVGAMYPNRREILEKLAIDYPHLKMAFYGRYVGLSHPFKYLAFLFSKKKKFFRNKTIHYSKVNELYNQSKICLNINGFQTQNGWSSRLIEIGLTSSYQLFDRNDSIESCFKECVGLFSNYQELKELIDLYLNDEEKRIKKAEQFYSVCKDKYTYHMAMKNVLNELFNRYTTRFREMLDEKNS